VKVPHKTDGAALDRKTDSTKYLPAPNQAAIKAQAEAAANGRVATSDEMAAAYRDAAEAEERAVRSGNTALVDPARLETIRAAISAEDKATENAKATANCPQIEAGSSEILVYRCMGRPDHVNSDLYVDQLVYKDGTFVYIDRKTSRVENVQWTSN
jgi:hypothetical protein